MSILETLPSITQELKLTLEVTLRQTTINLFLFF